MAGVAQMVERLICNQRVTGSIPVASTIFTSSVSALPMNPRVYAAHIYKRYSYPCCQVGNCFSSQLTNALRGVVRRWKRAQNARLLHVNSAYSPVSAVKITDYRIDRISAQLIDFYRCNVCVS